VRPKESHTAILFFSRSPEAEAKFKRWTGNRDINLQIARTLHKHALHFLKKSGLPVFEIDENRQCGKTFGERFNNAFSDIYDRGFHYVIGVGNDLVGIEDISWSVVQERLQSEQVVIGPDCRGGVYLLGLSRKMYQHIQLSSMPWQKRTLFDELVASVPKYYPLRRRYDVNGEADVVQLLRNDRTSRLIRLIRRLFKSIRIATSINSTWSATPLLRLKDRAPPVYC